MPRVVPMVNAAVAAALAQPRAAARRHRPICQAKAQAIAVAGRRQAGRRRAVRARRGRCGRASRASPELDGDTLALAAGAGRRDAAWARSPPDLLAVSLSATDYVGHDYGTEGEEMCLQLLELDREIGDFLGVLDSRGIDYAVALTADHGGKDIPERERLREWPTRRGSIRRSAAPMGARLAAQLGIDGPGLFGEAVRRHVCRPSVCRRRPEAVARRRGRGLPRAPAGRGGVHRRRDRRDAASDHAARQWSLIERARASYYPGRSGDFFVVLKKDVTPIADTSHGYVATHGSPWDYDRRVPILFWRPGFRGSDRRSGGRHGRHHADAGGADRASARARIGRRHLPRWNAGVICPLALTI